MTHLHDKPLITGGKPGWHEPAAKNAYVMATLVVLAAVCVLALCLGGYIWWTR